MSDSSRRERVASARCLAVLLALVGGVWPSAGWAQDPSEQSVRAAFLFNFAKFTTWPADALAADAPIVFCVADSTVADALVPLLSGRTIGGHALQLLRVKADDRVNGCAVWYMSRFDARKDADVVARLRRVPTLSVADTEDFVMLGGVVALYPDRGQMRFAINVGAAERANLRLGAQLLSLARIVKEGSDGPG